MFNRFFIFLTVVLAALGCEPTASTTTTQMDEDQFFEPAYQPLAKAVRQGSLNAIDTYLNRGLDVNHVGKQNMTLVMWAMTNHNKKSLNHLLEKGADPNYKDAQGTQPVGVAAGLDDIAYLQILLNHRGDPNSEDRGEKALITAVMRLFVDHMYLLLDKGADINSRGTQFNAPAVNILAGLNQLADVAKFLERGASYTIADDNGTTLPYEIQNATPNKGTDGYTWQKKVKQMLVERGVRFPVESPYYDKPGWRPIRAQWYASAQGKPYRDKLDALGRDPDGFGQAYRTLYRADKEAFQTWMAQNNVAEPGQ